MATAPAVTRQHYLGIDVGTSGCRSCLIDDEAQLLAGVHTPLPAPVRNGNAVQQDAGIWWTALAENLDQLGRQHDLSAVTAMTLDATSATLLCCDRQGTPLGPALMYNDARATTQAQRIARVAPPDCAAHGPSASLAKLLWLLETGSCNEAGLCLHQADWLLGRLCGQYGFSDENNALKLGYDVIQRRWPDWLDTLDIPPQLLPEVVPAGQVVSTLAVPWSERWGLPRDTRVLAGTTDSTASFIATGARPGEAVTSLGSTLVLKVMAGQPVFAPEYGVYSHRLGDHWLVGGASNSGGAVLRQYFRDEDLDRLAARIDIETPTGLDYYPLPATGERFPVNDPGLAPRLQPRPDDDVLFFQGILEGIAGIEHDGYRKLAALGAPWPSRIISTGGGASNEPWRTMRARLNGIPVTAATHQDAAYGTALLARRGAT